jgi:hypothetical protein
VGAGGGAGVAAHVRGVLMPTNVTGAWGLCRQHEQGHGSVP